MEPTFINEDQLKQVIKTAILEAFDERRDFFYDLIEEVVEDLALASAIKEGETTEPIAREDVFQILEGQS